MTRETRVGSVKPKPLPRNESPAFYEGLGRAIKVSRTSMGLERKDLAEKAGVSYAYLSDIETGRGRPGSRSFLAIAEALDLSPSTLMREAERYRTQIEGGPDVVRSLDEPTSPESMVARLNQTASPEARRWFHAGRLMAEAGLDLTADQEGQVHVGELAEELGGASTSWTELHRLIDELSPEDAEVVLTLVRRLRAGR